MAFKFLRGKKSKEKNSFVIHSFCYRPEYYMENVIKKINMQIKSLIT